MFEIKKLPKSEVEITGEIPADEFERAFSKAMTELNQKAGIPGFRPGHVPENVLIEKVGEAAILEEAAEIALREAYPKMLEENKIEAIGRPEITITKIARKNPLGFKIKTAVLPEITLPDYKKIAGEAMTAKEEVKVEERNRRRAGISEKIAKKRRESAGWRRTGIKRRVCQKSGAKRFIRPPRTLARKHPLRKRTEGPRAKKNGDFGKNILGFKTGTARNPR